MRRWILAGLCALWVGTAGAQPSTAQLERGRYLVEIAGHCANCHGSRGPDGAPLPGRGLAGGWVIEEGPMRAVVPNITPDRETGIGNWTLAQFTRALREEIGADGRPLMPPMGRGRVWAAMTDQDIADLFAYFRSLPPLD